jgi:16S rRNA (guanine527-N7)-methyltransferase
MKQAPLTDRLIIDTLRPYQIEADVQLCASIRTYIDLLLFWNRKISLTTVADPGEILRFHFGESMFGVGAVPIRHGRLADVGTGPGFPSIPIRMVAPEMECVLIESNQKKATFIAEVLRTLKLENVEIFRGRMEDYPISAPSFDFTVSRALGIHQNFLKWSAARLNSSGQVVFWIGDEDGAKIAQEKSWIWRSLIRIPGSSQRSLLVGSCNI